MEKEEELDIRFEQIEALNAKVMNSKMILHTLRYQVNQAQQEGNEEKVEELNNRIEAQNKLIETHREQIKKLNGEIRSNWRQPEREIKQEEKEDEEEIKIDIPQRKKIKWYNFIQRFKRWMDNRKQKALNEAPKEKIEEEKVIEGIEKEGTPKDFKDSLNPKYYSNGELDYSKISEDEISANSKLQDAIIEDSAKKGIEAYKKFLEIEKQEDLTGNNNSEKENSQEKDDGFEQD